MTKDDQDNRINFSLRISDELSKKIEKKARDMGLSKNAYINMVLHGEVKKNSAGA
ncbi:toxin-antitoxin system HicB family antitoxin [Pseudobacillus badius]|uniref:toxin-antitoxin system HicB family antitoxin n=1 Tax=Bacillus badius TaxID=1455 RepID=UPI001CBCA660|nr:toxin-antitoxin system HicB family antitoxin [Bacillus badius]